MPVGAHVHIAFYLTMSENDKLMLFEPRQSQFLSIRASCRTGCKRTVLGSLKLSRFEPSGLAHRVNMSGVSCWKSTINSSRSLRRLMSWKSPYRPSRKSCHKNISTRRWRTLQEFDCLLGCGCQCNNSVHLQVCILISSSTNWLFSEPPTDSWGRLGSERWEIGVVSV